MVSSRRRSDRFGSIKRQYSQAQMLNTVIQIAGNQYSRRLQDSNVKIVFRLYLNSATVCLPGRLIYLTTLALSAIWFRISHSTDSLALPGFHSIQMTVLCFPTTGGILTLNDAPTTTRSCSRSSIGAGFEKRHRRTNRSG